MDCSFEILGSGDPNDPGSDDFLYWVEEIFGATSIVRQQPGGVDGDYSLMVVADDGGTGSSGDGVYQIRSNTATDTHYLLTFWYKSVGDYGPAVVITDNANITYFEYDIPTSHDWRYNRIEFFVPAYANNEIKLSFIAGNGTDTFWIDSVSLDTFTPTPTPTPTPILETPTPIPFDCGIVPNCSFEAYRGKPDDSADDDIIDWFEVNPEDGKIEVTTDAIEGDVALMLSTGKNGNPRVWVSVDVIDRYSYWLDLWYLSTGGDSTITISNGGFDYVYTLPETSTWTRKTIKVDYNLSGSAILKIETYNNTTAKFDAVMLHGVESTLTPTPTPIWTPTHTPTPTPTPGQPIMYGPVVLNEIAGGSWDLDGDGYCCGVFDTCIEVYRSDDTIVSNWTIQRDGVVVANLQNYMFGSPPDWEAFYEVDIVPGTYELVDESGVVVDRIVVTQDDIRSGSLARIPDGKFWFSGQGTTCGYSNNRPPIGTPIATLTPVVSGSTRSDSDGGFWAGVKNLLGITR